MRHRPPRAALALLVVLAVPAALALPRGAGAQDTVAVPVPRDTTRAARVTPGEAVRLHVRDAGPGSSGRMLRNALARPHGVAFADSLAARPLAFPRGAAYDRSVIVLGGDATMASRVNGDVVVIGGDLYIRPGAEIEGRAIAIGGGVYRSTLAIVRGGHFAFRGHTFVATRTARGIALDYREIDTYQAPLVELIGLYGFGLPRYDRSNGLSLGFGPLVNLRGGRIEIEPAVTYRSHLGAFDPDGIVRVHLDRRTDVVLRGGRGSFSNEGWIRGDIANSISSLLAGGDARNWWRADRAELNALRRWETEAGTWEPYIGLVAERAWSTGPDSAPPHVVWSLTNRGDRDEGPLRLNPPVAKGTITSAVAGGTLRWERQGIAATLAFRGEQAVSAPLDARFTQLTADAGVAFVVVRNHRLQTDLHAIHTFGDDAPPQRFSYLGGSGTIPTRELLEFGGDHLFHLDSRYTIPIPGIEVAYLGSPSVGVRHVIGSAGVGEYPSFVQNIGVRAALGFVRAEFMYDPERRDSDFSLGFSLGR